MATINTTEDLVRLLREDREFREAARKELLPQELLDLPAAHAAFEAEMRTFVAEMNAFVAEMNAFVAEMNAFVAEMNAFVAEMQEFVKATNRRFNAIELRLDGLDEKYGRLDANVRRLNDDFSDFRGDFAERRAARDPIGIAMALCEAKGLDADLDTNGTSVITLSRNDIRALARAYGSRNLAAIPRGDRISFYDSDIIIEVSQEDAETYYIAVEVSNACNGRDTRRAIRHAELLTRFTGKQAWAAIAGTRIDDRIQDIVDSGQVFWYPFNEGGIAPS